ncbi:MAG: hypothetical protein U0P45_07895 [Acidimicrobiales bacterium]
MISLPALGVEADRGLAASLDEVLRAHDCSLEPPVAAIRVEGGEPSRVVVLISELAAGDEQFISSVEELAADPDVELLPVSAGPGTSGVLPDLSHLRLEQLGIERTAERIAIVAHTGASDLAAWNRVADQARTWIRSGRPRSTALSPTRADAVGALLLRPIASVDPDDRKAVADLTAHSRRRHRRQRVAASVVIAAAVLLLTSTSVVALRQSRTARGQARRAQSAADSARADRLLRSAADQSQFDPDLPWILASAAVDADASLPVKARAATLVGQLWAHTSHKLPRRPLALVPTSSDLVAVMAFGGGRVDIVDSRTGRVTGHYSTSHGRQIGAWTVSPDGQFLALEAAHKLLVVDLRSKSAPVVLHQGDVQDVEWPTPGKMFFVGDSTIYSVDPKTQKVSPFARVPGADQIAIARQQGWLAVGHGDAITLISPQGKVRGTYDAPEIKGFQELETSFGEEDLTVQVPDALLRVPLQAFARADGDQDKIQRITPYGSAIREISATPGSPAAACMVDGSLGQISDGASILIDTTPAHRGTCLGVAVLPDGTWTSIGSDGMLRHWSAPRPDGYVDGQGTAPILQDLVNAYGTGESVRPMVAAGRGEAQATATAPGAYSVALVDRKTGTVDRHAPVGGIDSPIRPSEKPAIGVRFYPSATVRWDVESRSGPDLPLPPVELERSVTAISPNGRYIAVAGQTSSYLLDAEGSGERRDRWTEEPYGQAAQPVGTDVDDHGTVRVITLDGTLFQAGRRPVRLLGGSRTVVSGHLGVDGTVVLVGADGTVFVGDSRRTRRLLRTDNDIDPIAVRISDDGTRAAIIGFTKTQILDLHRGLVVAQLTVRNDYRAVSDVAFDDDPSSGALIVRKDGAISRISLVEPSRVDSFLRRRAPRRATPAETTIYGLADR